MTGWDTAFDLIPWRSRAAKRRGCDVRDTAASRRFERRVLGHGGDGF